MVPKVHEPDIKLLDLLGVISVAEKVCLVCDYELSDRLVCRNARMYDIVKTDETLSNQKVRIISILDDGTISISLEDDGAYLWACFGKIKEAINGIA